MSEFFGQEVQVVTVGVPAGTMVDWPGDNPPNSDWELAHGQALARATYPELFAVLGVKYGAGDGSGTQFNLPDTRGRVLLGADTTRPLGNTGGAEVHKHTKGSLAAPDHLHAIPHSHHMAHYHGVSGSTGAPSSTYGTPAGSYAPAAHGAHTHAVGGGTDWGTRNDTDGPSVGTTQAADRSLALSGDMDDASSFPPYLAVSQIIKLIN